MVDRKQFMQQVKMSIPCQRHIKIVKVEMDNTTIYRQEAEIGLLPLLIGHRFLGVTQAFTLNPLWILASQMAQDNNNNNSNILLKKSAA